jgi:exo-1,4-beta-D-glucosaminidase
MPATVLQVLEDNGVYKDLYFGMNLASTVPKDLWKHDWWYRTAFEVPPGHDDYYLILNGVNYRADIWLNGQLIASRSQVVGMYRRFEFDVTNHVHPGRDNILAVKVTPEQKLTGIAMFGGGSGEGVELADSWLDWINFKYLGVPEKWLSFVPDRNAGVWKKVYLTFSGQVSIRDPYVSSDLPLPALSPATLGVYADVQNHGDRQVTGTLTGEITRQGKPPIRFAKTVTLAAHEAKEVAFTSSEFPALVVDQPDLWWPYTWGKPNLYDLRLEFKINGNISDAKAIPFGIRKVTQHRDSDESFPKIGKGGNFYLKVNGKDYLIRGGAYTPDLLFKNEPERDRTIMRYAKDLGINMLRWELKIADDEMLELSDREGMPVMQGWMCCMQWESWDQWDAEDHRIAHESMQSQIRSLRAHPSAFIWANGSDGLPPDQVLQDYHQVLQDLHWQSAVVDTVAHRNRSWDGIHMAGPYTWYPPYYWFSEKFGPARGSSAEEGNNETILPLESLKKFIPADKLWPVNEYWYVHCGGIPGNNELENIRLALDKRYGPSSNAAEFARKAQVAIYENVRAQFETYAASGWDTHKMMIYWMLDNAWPSFFGHLFDYYFKQGGGYFGAKKALRPLTAVFDSYATGDRSKANIYLVNQTTQALNRLQVSATLYNLDGSRKHSEVARDLNATPASSMRALTLPRYADLGPVYFVRLQVRDYAGDLLAENTYWQSTTDDVLAEPDEKDMFAQMKLRQVSWGDYSALDQMPAADVAVQAQEVRAGDETKVKISLANNSDHVAFFVRAEVLNHADGEEILPITYDDNYVTVFPHETRAIEATIRTSQLDGLKPAVRIEGYNVTTKTRQQIDH